MTKSMKSLMMGAALAGFMAGNTVVAQTTSTSNSVSSADNGPISAEFFQDKHACKGQNSCKGKGGCKSGDNGCKGKNSCKGKGGCATDGSKPPRVSLVNQPQGPERSARWPLLSPRPRQVSRSARCRPSEGSTSGIMPANRFNGFTEYGVGIGLRIPHYNHILEKKPVVDWFEIISENFMVDGGRPLQILDQILEQYRVVQHGVSMYFGSVEPLNREHLKRLKALVRRTNTPWLSDHLCWGSVDGTYSHDLLPMPYTFEAAAKTAQKIREVRDFVEVPVVVENVSSYAEFHASEMTEWQFLTEVVERADCGILLDVNNIYVSSRNHSFDPFEYVNSVPHERVAQIHIAGHSKFEKYILDTHDHPVIDPVWNLYARAIELIGPTATLLEWDDHIPSFDEVHDEALKANRYVAEKVGA